MFDLCAYQDLALRIRFGVTQEHTDGERMCGRKRRQPQEPRNMVAEGKADVVARWETAARPVVMLLNFCRWTKLGAMSVEPLRLMAKS